MPRCSATWAAVGERPRSWDSVATAAPTWGVYSGFELFESVARPGAEEAIDNEKYEYKPRDFDRALVEGRSIAPLLQRLNELRREHPALQRLRGTTFHRTDSEQVIAYTRHLPAHLSPTGEEDLVLTGDSAARTGRRPRTRIPSAVAFALRANCGPRWMSGFLLMFMAFLLRENPEAGRGHVMPLLLHGDAAFAGQGVIAECFTLMGLKGYRT